MENKLIKTSGRKTGRDFIEDTGIEERKICKWILKEWGRSVF
jgi:hypothetical protein